LSRKRVRNVSRGQSPRDSTLKSDAYVRKLLEKQARAIEVAYAQELAAPYDVPVSIFARPELSPFEALCTYLSEEKKLRPSELARTLGKPYMDVYLTTRNARKKYPGKLLVVAGLTVPLTELLSDLWTMNEALVFYLREKKKLEFHDIARLLLRDRRNIWTIYKRALNKRVRGGAT